MSSTSPPETTSFPYPTQVVYDDRAAELRVAVDISPATREDVTVAVGTRRLRIAVDRDASPEIDSQRDEGDTDADANAVAERTITPLPPDLEFGDERHAFVNNGVLSVSIETRS